MAGTSPASPTSFGSSGGSDVRLVGDYMLRKQIGSGSFSVVWRGVHRVQGFEVAVKEIAMEKLNPKLQESLLSEIAILKQIKHPNIISLIDIIKASGRIYIVLEYCRGGDLSMYLRQYGKVSEATAKHFMQQLASGLLVLRQNNLIHRDLKPQNLLLTSRNPDAVLKIADFGFARSLDPSVLAETLCGSPLYMAPEIMHLQKYDAKADLWSIGAILFQLVTGKTPFTGNNQLQLIQNIMRSNGLQFPPDNKLSFDCIDLCKSLLRRNPVERITFDEFFRHRFLSNQNPDESLGRTHSDARNGLPSVEFSSTRPTEEIPQGGSPLLLDNDSNGQDIIPSFPKSKGSVKPTYGFSVNNRVDKSPSSCPSKTAVVISKHGSANKLESTSYDKDCQISLALNDREIVNTLNDPTVEDSLEFVDQEYVLVSGPTSEMSSVSAPRPHSSPIKSDTLPGIPKNSSTTSAPMPIVGAPFGNKHDTGRFENRSPESRSSQGSMEAGEFVEQPSPDGMTRIRALRQCAYVISELVKEAVNGRLSEAFSIQLVVLAIWAQAVEICHPKSASALQGSSQPLKNSRSTNDVSDTRECYTSTDSPLSEDICSQTEKDFLYELGHAEELAKDLGEITERPDAIELIFQAALTLGRHGGVNEMMGNMERASAWYAKAVTLLYFLLVEASSLALNPPLTLTNSLRSRLRSYIYVIRQGQSRISGMRGSLD